MTDHTAACVVQAVLQDFPSTIGYEPHSTSIVDSTARKYLYREDEGPTGEARNKEHERHHEVHFYPDLHNRAGATLMQGTSATVMNTDRGTTAVQEVQQLQLHYVENIDGKLGGTEPPRPAFTFVAPDTMRSKYISEVPIDRLSQRIYSLDDETDDWRPAVLHYCYDIKGTQTKESAEYLRETAVICTNALAHDYFAENVELIID